MEHRTVEDVRRDLTQACLKAGEIQFNMDFMKRDLERVNDMIRGLNAEALKLEQEQKEKGDAAPAIEEHHEQESTESAAASTL